DGVLPVGVAAILMPVVEAVFIAATEAFAEIVVVVSLIYVVTAITVVRILIAIALLIVGLIAILPVRLPRAKALLVAVVDGLSKHVCAVLIGFVVAAATRVPVVRRRVGVVRVVATRLLIANLLPAQDVLLLITILVHASLLL